MRSLALLPLALGALSAAASDSPDPVVFNWFEYTGRDPVFSAPTVPGEFRNPILAGFYPDPDICRVDGTYYIVNSSFAYFPGIPVFRSNDLVNWTQVGNVIDRPSQLNYDGLGVSRGIFAPSLSHHGDTFYLVCTFVDGGGNFLMTASNPAGPWSDPVWLGFDGIDPSLFFDDNGRAWLLNNGQPPDNRPLYDGHRAIWMQEFDPVARKLIGPREIKVNGGADIAKHPVWIEGPHLFKKDGWYYLICAEGGTAEGHSEVVFRSRSVRGPYVPGPENPILTQRTLPDSRANPVTCTGHADFVDTPGGDWWAVFLGCRPYATNFYNTGRETFMLPVTWKDGWPTILPPGQPVPLAVRGPAGVTSSDRVIVALSGNFTWRDSFDGALLAPPWVMLRRPHETWWHVGNPYPWLMMAPSRDTLSGKGNPAFIGRRLQHAHFDASTEVEMTEAAGTSAGLVAFQNESHHYFFGMRRAKDGSSVFVERLNGKGPETIARVPVTHAAGIGLRMSGDDGVLKFEYATHGDGTDGGAWRTLAADVDATVLSTQAAGGFVGTMIGLHARIDAP